MKFLLEFFGTEDGLDKFAQFLRIFVDLKVPLIQFDVLCWEDLLATKDAPEHYRGLTIRVAGYTAHFTKLPGSCRTRLSPGLAIGISGRLPCYDKGR